MSVHKVELLIKDLLITAKYKDSQLQLNKSKFNIARLIHNCCQPIWYAGNYIIMQVDGELEVYPDPERVSQVIENMVSNARIFASAEEDIEVSLTRSGNFARIFVIDKGQGILK